MRPLLLSILALAVVVVFGACDVSFDDTRSDNRDITPVGVIRGTVTYSGPGPCSANGHILGVAVILLFSADDPPPPEGTATTAVNFATVPGDVLFANEQRSPDATVYCPIEHGDDVVRNVSAPFTVSPVGAGTYIAQSFYSMRGAFLPEIGIRSTPVRGDVIGGCIDAAAAAAHAGDPYYQPTFLPIYVGVLADSDGDAEAAASAASAANANGTDSSAADAAVPRPMPIPLVIPPLGFLRDNVAITIGSVVSTTPPYFYLDGAQAGDPTVPVLTMSQDLHVLAPPASMDIASANAFQASFPNLLLDFGLPAAESPDGTDPTQPFLFAYNSTDGFHVASQGQLIAEGTLPALWPEVALTKLADPADGSDPQELLAQGDATLPRVILQGITLEDGDVALTVADPPPTHPDPTGRAPSLTALLRPSVICLDPSHPASGGVLTTPYLTGKRADAPNGADVPLFDPATVIAASGGLVREVRQGCLPTGRYAVHVIAPTGQAWTTPNEAGSCAASEGAPTSATATSDPATCSIKPRAVLASQGLRAVVQITAATSAAGKALCARAPVPPECLQNAANGASPASGTSGTSGDGGGQ